MQIKLGFISGSYSIKEIGGWEVDRLNVSSQFDQNMTQYFIGYIKQANI